MITVITCTARQGFLNEWMATLQRQTYTKFEALFVDELYSQRHTTFVDLIGSDSRFRHIVPPPKAEGAFWNLSRSLNYALSISRGDLVVFLQDYIEIPTNGLESFSQRHQDIGQALICGVGNKYNLDGTLFFQDPRIEGRGFHVCNPIEWEGNYASVDREICEKLGGFDESFDSGWGYDNVNFSERAQVAGYLSWLDEDNVCRGIAHETVFGEQDFKNAAPNNENLWRQKNQLIYATGQFQAPRNLYNVLLETRVC